MKQEPGATKPASPVETIAELLLSDDSRQKQLPVRLTFPSKGDRLQLIIFSHGAGASKDDYLNLTRFWASEGFLCIQPSHADSLALRKQQGQEADLRKILLSLSHDYSAWVNRVADLSAIIDLLPELERRSGLSGRIDSSSIAAAGHSYGAFTVQLLAGARLTCKAGAEEKGLSDRRISAALLLSAQGRSRNGFKDGAWDGMSLPMMIVTGSKDRGPKGQKPEWRTEPFHLSPAGDKYLVFIEGANHLALAGSGSGQGQEPAFEFVKKTSSLFLNTYLKQDALARQILLSGEKESGDDVSVRISTR